MDIFDEWGRAINLSFQDVGKQMAEPLKGATNSIDKLADKIDKLQKIIQDNLGSNEARKSAAAGSVLKPGKESEELAKHVAKIKEIMEKSQDTTKKISDSTGMIEKAMSTLSSSFSGWKPAVDSLVTTANQMLSALSGTLKVEDTGLAKLMTKMMDRGGAGTSKKLEQFMRDGSNLAKAGLKKGSIFTHDTTCASILTEMMNDVKQIGKMIQTIATGMTLSPEERDYKFVQATFDTLREESKVTQEMIYKTLKTIEDVAPVTVAEYAAARPGRRGFSEDAMVEFSAAGNELLRLMRQRNESAGISKDITGNPAEFQTKLMDLFSSGKISTKSVEGTQKTLKYMSMLKEHERTIMTEAFGKLTKLAAQKKIAGPGSKYEDLFDQQLAHIINTANKFAYRIDVELARRSSGLQEFSYELERASGYLKNLSTLLSYAAPSSYGVGPKAKLADPAEMVKEAAKARADWTKEVFAAVYETTGRTGKEVAGLDKMYHDMGTNLTEIFMQTGALPEVFRKTWIKNYKRGIADVNRVTKLGLSLGKTIGADAEQTAEEFADWHQYIGLSAGQLETVARRTKHIGNLIGVSGDNLLQAVKSAKQFAEEMRNAANFTSEAGSRLIQLSAAGKKFGVDKTVNAIQEGLSSTVGLLEKSSDKTRNLLFMAAGRAGRLEDLRQGNVLNSPQAMKDMVGGMEDVLRMFTRGRDVKSLSGDERMQLNLALQNAFGVGLGEFERVLKALREGSMTAADKLADIEKKLSGTLSTQDREALKLQRDQVKSLMKQEDFNKLLSRGENIKEKLGAVGPGQARQVLLSEFGGQAGVNSYLGAIREDLLKMATDAVIPKLSDEDAKDANKKALYEKRLAEVASSKGKMQDIAAELEAGIRSGNLSPEGFLSLVDKAQAAQGGLSSALEKMTQRDNFAELDYNINVLNLELQKKIEEHTQAIAEALGGKGMAGLETIFAGVTAGGAVLSVAGSLLQNLLGLKTGGGFMEWLFGAGGEALPKGAAAWALPAEEALGAGAGGVGGGVAGLGRGASGMEAAVAAGVKGGSFLGKAGKFLSFGAKAFGIIGAALELVTGGVQGFKDTGTIGGALMGVLTGGGKRGSFLAKYLGIDEKGVASDLLGIGGAGVRGGLIGAGIGALFGPPGIAIGAAVGAAIGAIAELYKVLTDKTSKLAGWIWGVWERAFGYISSAWNKVYTGFVNGFKPVLATYERLRGKVLDAIGKVGGAIAKAFGIEGGIDINFIIDHFGKNLEALGAVLGWLFEYVIGPGLNGLLSIGELLMDSVNWDIVAATVTLAFDTIVESSKAFYTAMTAVATAILSIPDKIIKSLMGNPLFAPALIRILDGATAARLAKGGSMFDLSSMFGDPDKEMKKIGNLKKQGVKPTIAAPGTKGFNIPKFGIPASEADFKALGVVNSIEDKIEPAFRKAVGNKSVSDKVLFDIAKEIYTSMHAGRDFQSAADAAFMRHLGVTAGAVGTMDLPDVSAAGPAGNKIPDWAEKAIESLDIKGLAADTEKAKIDEGNKKLDSIDKNTMEVSNDMKELKELMAAFIKFLSKKSNNTPRGFNNFNVQGSPANYFDFEIDINGNPGLGGTIPLPF